MSASVIITSRQTDTFDRSEHDGSAGGSVDRSRGSGVSHDGRIIDWTFHQSSSEFRPSRRGRLLGRPLGLLGGPSGRYESIDIRGMTSS